MTENNYISGHIRRVYARRLVSPVLYLILLVILWLAFPIYDILFPRTLTASDDLSTYKNQRSSYVETTLTTDILPDIPAALLAAPAATIITA